LSEKQKASQRQGPTKELQNLHMGIDHGRERERFALYMKFWSIVNRRTTPIPPHTGKLVSSLTHPGFFF